MLDTQTRVESDIQRLVPQDMPALRDLDALQRSTGVGGQLDVIVRGDDVSSPRVIAWMAGYQTAVLKEQGFSARRGCGQAELCPAFSLPDLFTTTGSRADAAAIDTLLDAVPPYLSRSVITADRRTATLAFGIRLMPLDEQAAVIDAMRARLDDGRPAGVQAALAGLPVLAADANAEVTSSTRRMLTLLAGLVAVALVLLLALRDVRRALVPLVPIALATGWSALVLFALRVPLNPLSVTLGALVIAISTEFSVLLSERYREERRRGRDAGARCESTYRSTGAAVLASGATAIAGFAVLVVSDIRMLRDFGFVTVVDLTVSLLGVLVVLPAVLLLTERGRAAPAPDRGRDASLESPLRRGVRPSARATQIIAASARRWRSVIEPTVFVSVMPMLARNLAQRVAPQRRWLSRSSEIVMLAASHGHSRITSPTVVVPLATLRLSSARARRTSFARRSACICCGAGASVAVASCMCPPRLPRLVREAAVMMSFACTSARSEYPETAVRRYRRSSAGPRASACLPEVPRAERPAKLCQQRWRRQRTTF